MTDTSDLLVLLAVIAARLFVPLAIPRYPIPAGIAALVIDGGGQTIFQVFTLPLAGYQSYDKALDISYQSIEYLSTLRNWTNLAAFVIVLPFANGSTAVPATLFSVLLLTLLVTFYDCFRPYSQVRRFRAAAFRTTRAGAEGS